MSTFSNIQVNDTATILNTVTETLQCNTFQVTELSCNTINVGGIEATNNNFTFQGVSGLYFTAPYMQFDANNVVFRNSAQLISVEQWRVTDSSLDIGVSQQSYQGSLNFCISGTSSPFAKIEILSLSNNFDKWLITGGISTPYVQTLSISTNSIKTTNISSTNAVFSTLSVLSNVTLGNVNITSANIVTLNTTNISCLSIISTNELYSKTNVNVNNNLNVSGDILQQKNAWYVRSNTTDYVFQVGDFLPISGSTNAFEVTGKTLITDNLYVSKDLILSGALLYSNTLLLTSNISVQGTAFLSHTSAYTVRVASKLSVVGQTNLGNLSSNAYTSLSGCTVTDNLVFQKDLTDGGGFRWDYSTQRLGLNVFTPLELFHISGGNILAEGNVYVSNILYASEAKISVLSCSTVNARNVSSRTLSVASNGYISVLWSSVANISSLSVFNIRALSTCTFENDVYISTVLYPSEISTISFNGTYNNLSYARVSLLSCHEAIVSNLSVINTTLLSNTRINNLCVANISTFIIRALSSATIECSLNVNNHVSAIQYYGDALNISSISVLSTYTTNLSCDSAVLSRASIDILSARSVTVSTFMFVHNDMHISNAIYGLDAFISDQLVCSRLRVSTTASIRSLTILSVLSCLSYIECPVISGQEFDCLSISANAGYISNLSGVTLSYSSMRVNTISGQTLNISTARISTISMNNYGYANVMTIGQDKSDFQGVLTQHKGGLQNTGTMIDCATLKATYYQWSSYFYRTNQTAFTFIQISHSQSTSQRYGFTLLLDIITSVVNTTGLTSSRTYQAQLVASKNLSATTLNIITGTGTASATTDGALTIGGPNINTSSDSGGVLSVTLTAPTVNSGTFAHYTVAYHARFIAHSIMASDAYIDNHITQIQYI